MDLLTTAFSHVCGQGRSFIVDGSALPVCERCFGLYAGAALTAAWLFAAGLWRRGLPDRPVALLNAAMLLAAMAGGLHWIDPGPAWRLACGLWTGHVAVLWLIGGSGPLRQGPAWGGRAASSKSTARGGQARRLNVLDNCDMAWPRRDQAQALAAGPILAVLALAFARFVDAGWHVWAALVLLGAASLIAALAGAALAVLGRLGATARRLGTLGPAAIVVALLAGGCTMLAPRPIDPETGIMNFAKVSDALYRGGQPDADGFVEAKRLGVRTVVSLRTLDSDRRLLKGLGMKYLHISFKAGHPEDEDVIAFLQVATDPANQPVLVHCNWGTDRCGMMTAVWRVVVERWDKKRALQEMHEMGFNDGWTAIEHYLERLDASALRSKAAAARAPELKYIP